MKILYSFFIGMIMIGAWVITMQLVSPGTIYDADPQISLWVGVALFFTGCVIGWFDACRKQRKKEEEEERQAEQDRTNELMREYLKKKLQEENEKQ